MAKPKNLHNCVVKNCPNTKITRPDIEFFTVPKELPKRKLWVKAAGLRLNKIGLKSVTYVCEEHFDLQNDMDKFRLKPDVVPHKRLNLQDVKKTLPIEQKQVEQRIENIKEQNIFNNKVQNMPDQISIKCIPTIKIEKQEIEKEVTKENIIYIREEPIKNKPLSVNPIRIQHGTSPKPPPPITQEVEQKIAKRNIVNNNVEYIPKKLAISNKFIPPTIKIEKQIINEVAKEQIIHIRDEQIKNKPNKNEIEFIAVPVNRAEFCKETVPIRPQKPVKLQTCESCGKQFRFLHSHIKSSDCKNYWRRLENRIIKKLGPVKIAPKPSPVQYKVSFVPEQRQINITFNQNKMK